MHHTIIGIVIASTLLIIPVEYTSNVNLAISIACFLQALLFQYLWINWKIKYPFNPTSTFFHLVIPV